MYLRTFPRDIACSLQTPPQNMSLVDIPDKSIFQAYPDIRLRGSLCIQWLLSPQKCPGDRGCTQWHQSHQQMTQGGTAHTPQRPTLCLRCFLPGTGGKTALRPGRYRIQARMVDKSLTQIHWQNVLVRMGGRFGLGQEYRYQLHRGCMRTPTGCQVQPQKFDAPSRKIHSYIEHP